MSVYESSSKLLSVLHHIMGINPTVFRPCGSGEYDPRLTIMSLRFSIPGTFDPPPPPPNYVFLTLTQDHFS